MECLLNWDAANQIGYKGILGIIEAFSRADEEQGRGTIHGHTLAWIKEFGRLRDMVCDGDEETRKQAKDEFIKYLKLVMNASYPDEFEVAHHCKGECLADGCDKKAVDGKHYCRSHSEFQPQKDDFVDCDWQEFRKARHEDGCHDVGGCVMTCKTCNEKEAPVSAVNAGLERMAAEMKSKVSFPISRECLHRACMRHVYDLNLEEEVTDEEPDGVVVDVPLEEDAEFCATILNPWNNRTPSGEAIMEPVEDFDLPDEFDFDLGNGPVTNEDDFWNDPTVRRALLRLRYDDHAPTHAKSCFKKGCECRFFFPFLSCLATALHEDKTKEELKRHKLNKRDGSAVNVPRHGIESKRPQGSQCINTHSLPMSDILNCNTNVSTGDVAQLMYQTLYASKNTQEDDDKPRQVVAARVIRSINRREEMDRANDASASEPDFVVGLKLMLSALNAAASRCTVSAPMAANLGHQKGSRFVHSHGFQPLLLGQMEDELEGRPSREGKFTVRRCQSKTGSAVCWPDKASNDYIYRNEELLSDMCLYQLTMQYEKSYAKKELKSGEEGEQQWSSRKLRFASRMEEKHPGHDFAFLKQRRHYVIPIVHLRKVVEDEEDQKWDRFAEGQAQPSESPSGQPNDEPSESPGPKFKEPWPIVQIAGRRAEIRDRRRIEVRTLGEGSAIGFRYDVRFLEGNKEDRFDVDEEDIARDANFDTNANEAALEDAQENHQDKGDDDDIAVDAETFLGGRICRVSKLGLGLKHPSDEVRDAREQHAKAALMLFCPYRTLDELKFNGSYWEKFENARLKWIEEKKNYPCFESLDDWRNQYVEGYFWAKGFEILQNIEDRSAAMGAKGRAETELTRKTKCLTEGGKKKKKRELDNVKDISYFFDEPDEEADNAEVEAGTPEIDESKYRYNHNKLVDKNIGSRRLLNARLSSEESIFVQGCSDEGDNDGAESHTNKKAGKKETDAWRGKDYRTKIKLMAGSLVGGFDDVCSSLDDAEGKFVRCTEAILRRGEGAAVERGRVGERERRREFSTAPATALFSPPDSPQKPDAALSNEILSKHIDLTGPLFIHGFSLLVYR